MMGMSERVSLDQVGSFVVSTVRIDSNDPVVAIMDMLLEMDSVSLPFETVVFLGEDSVSMPHIPGLPYTTAGEIKQSYSSREEALEGHVTFVKRLQEFVK